MDCSSLVSDTFPSTTIRLPFVLSPANTKIRPSSLEQLVILDTGATRTSISKKVLLKHGYGKYTKSATKKMTAVGEISFSYCTVKSIKLANEFVYENLRVDVLEGWENRAVVGVIGIDVLSQLTFILSGEHKKFLLTNKSIPELLPLLSRTGFFI